MPIVIGGLLWFGFTLLLMVIMPETGFHPSPHLSQQHLGMQLHSAAMTFRHGLRLLRQHPTLLGFFAASFCISGIIEFFWWSAGQHILLDFQLPLIRLPLLGILKGNAWLGFLAVLRSMVLLLGLQLIQQRTTVWRMASMARVLTILTLLMLPALWLFASTGSLLLTIIAWLLVNACYDMSQPLRSTWLNQMIDSELRATLLSMHSQAITLGMLLGATALSAAGDWFGIRPVLLLGSLLLMPALVIYIQGALPHISKQLE